MFLSYKKTTMDLEYIRNYCLKKKGVTEGFPFGEDTLVFKVMSKIFMLTGFDIPLSVNLKCEPELSMELRERYEAVQPGYHMNKKHWNTIVVDGTIPLKEILKMIDHSYDMVVEGLKVKEKEKLRKMK